MKSEFKGKNHHLWKGDNVGYATLHVWVQKNRGVAIVCEKCQSTSKVEWANVSKKYKRDLDDWIQLCHSCHMKYDDIPKKVWETRRKKYGVNGHKETANWKGWKHTEESKLKMSKRRKGVKFTEEHKKNLKESIKRYWNKTSTLIKTLQ